MAENGGVPARQEPRDAKSKLAARLRERASADFGAPDSATRAILSLVAEERYDGAIAELKRYADSKPEYPQFLERSARYLEYAQGLVAGIKAKRSFPGVQNLAMAKQQELYERALAHFDDLRATMRKIEQIEREVRLEDVRSTVWVIKALVYCVSALLVAGFVVELSRGVLPSANVVLDSAASDAANWVCDKLGI